MLKKKSQNMFPKNIIAPTLAFIMSAMPPTLSSKESSYKIPAFEPEKCFLDTAHSSNEQQNFFRPTLSRQQMRQHEGIRNAPGEACQPH